ASRQSGHLPSVATACLRSADQRSAGSRCQNCRVDDQPQYSLSGYVQRRGFPPFFLGHCYKSEGYLNPSLVNESRANALLSRKGAGCDYTYNVAVDGLDVDKRGLKCG